MLRRILSSLVACSLVAGCSFGTPIPDSPPALCKFSQETLDRIKASEKNLPPSESGDLFALRLNREDSKQVHQQQWIDAQALAREVEICKVLQTKAATPQGGSKLDKRIEKLTGRTSP
jgi:hypothetical protein